MTSEKLREIAEKVKADPVWMEKLSGAKSQDEWLDLAIAASNEMGYPATKSEIEAFVEASAEEFGGSEQEVSDDQLASVVAGGSKKC